MTDIIALLQCLAPYLTHTTIQQMSCIIKALLALPGRVTMLNISRWAGQGGSYRTVQRLFYTPLPWALMFWWFFRQQLYAPADVYLLVGDECVVPKSGKHTHGLDRFYSSLFGKPIPAVAFFALSLVSTQQRRSYPTMVEQVIRDETNPTNDPAPAASQPQPPQQDEKRAVGRPQGSKNKDKTPVTLTAELLQIKTMIQKQLLLINGWLPLTYLVLDGHFGHNKALQMARQCGLQLVSKLRRDSALYFVYDGPYSGRGPHRKYGDKIDYRHIPDQYLQQTSIAGDIQTNSYQIQLLHKEFAQPLNVVIIVKINLQTQAWAHVVLFSSDLDLSCDKLIDYYSLRFQIEFNFRDAKQFWGLDDFMNVTSTAVTNAANLSLFMVNVAHCLLADLQRHSPNAGVLDLKSYFRGHKYVTETLKLLPQMPDPILLQQIYAHIAALGSIHSANSALGPP